MSAFPAGNRRGRIKSAWVCLYWVEAGTVVLNCTGACLAMVLRLVEKVVIMFVLSILSVLVGCGGLPGTA